MAIVRTIVVERHEPTLDEYSDSDERWPPSGWRVREGDRYIDHLSWDEMLGQIATVTHPMLVAKSLFGGMLTAEEHAERERERQERVAKRDADFKEA